MNPAWRTATVVALCQQMLDSRQFDALPILADALQDAGCDDAKLLSHCRDGEKEPMAAERLVNLVHSDERAAAVRWLENFVRQLNYDQSEPQDEWDLLEGSEENPHDYAFIIESGRNGIEEGGMYFGSDAGAEFFYDEANRREFFRNWSLVTGLPAPLDKQDRIEVSCAC